MDRPRLWLTRNGVLQIADCPRCNAARNELCRGTRGPRQAAHRERWLRAEIVRTRL
jgi:hypothetical protein